MKKACPALALSAALALTLAACGAAPEQGSGAAGASDFTACMVSDEGGFDDQSFNQSGKEGLDKAKAELGVKTITVESESAADYPTNIDSLIQQDCKLIFGVGFNLATDLATAAKANPDIEFALIDDVFRDTSGEELSLDNAKPLRFNTAESAYLAGYAAAAMSKTGTVATYGGQPIPTVQIFMHGFAMGVAKYNEDKGASVKVLGWDINNPKGGSFVGNFSDTAKGQSLTNQFISQGADVIMPVAGPVGLGTLSVVKESSGDDLVVWVDSDGFEATDGGPLILTSVVKEIGASVFDTVKEASSGSFTSKPYIGTLDNGGVALAPFHDQDSKVPAEVKTRVEELRTQIIDGSIDVTTPYDPS
ncbi:BMP family protein [Actinomyces slackii]|uniref:Purine nucleoside receptor A n=1 Tax=Actinomyces slackii TaxID=52774 RepID=A0A448KCD5_9ACTO|nr:BMP family ABC transporter substrate-binding protein [Actinomyces slackii]VEG74593.1 Purine nucleoside receptor A [Actinomyces slackii]